jgi:phosphoribosylformylglycinamidine synthase
MGQFVGAIEGIREACLALDYPVVSGNVSLYNETAGQAILPTPAIGAIGIMADYRKSIGVAFQDAGESILLIGDTKGHLGQSIYLREITGLEKGTPPPVDLVVERRNGNCVRGLIEAGDITACHDLSDGGLLVGLAEMAMASSGASGIGAEITDKSGDVALHAWAYGEDQARYLVTSKDSAKIITACEAAGVPVTELGTTGGADLSIAGETIAVAELKETHESWLPNYMAAAE